eukprot:CAMPEP_0115008022 /NCGR_PEP_ID=MMETSP0216-20121206/21624_1 /TAXON_ID=223996 /ORGANISM="Protocruzia adherens, Strain Boccale" /LENGTH=134 /DNA_ID=CAMNT_0002375269 /DNA_START=310 /DNA_END=714 /DNA_ORIENTATION=+
MTIAYIMYSQGLEPHDARSFVSKRHAKCFPNEGFWKKLLAFKKKVRAGKVKLVVPKSNRPSSKTTGTNAKADGIVMRMKMKLCGFEEEKSEEEEETKTQQTGNLEESAETKTDKERIGDTLASGSGEEKKQEDS